MEIPEFTYVLFFWAFVAGLASFFSPCVFPLMPVYLSYISGVKVEELGDRQRRVGLTSLAFIIGFVFLTTLQGAALGLAGSGFQQAVDFYTSEFGEGQRVLEIIAGVILIFFGIFALGIIKPMWLMRERRLRRVRRPASYAGVFLAGMVFSIGIGPCTPHTVGTIIALAGASRDPFIGAVLMLVYGLGMGVPFVLSGFLFASIIGRFSGVRQYFNVIKIISGIILIVFGILFITGEIDALSNRFFDWLPSFDV